MMTNTTEALPSLLTAAQVANILGVRDKRVYALGIPSVRLSSRSIRWRVESVREWIKEREEQQ